MRRLIVAAATLVCVAACDGDPRGDAGLDYLYGSPSERRQVLQASLGATDNVYARLRRAHYATGDARDWDALPVWNPRVEAVTTSDLAGARTLIADADFAAVPRALVLPSVDSRSAADAQVDVLSTALEHLGREAFFRYPVHLMPLHARLDAADVARYGLWVDGEHGLGGLVRAEMADGTARLAFTCSTCHAASANGSLVVGLGNASLDLGGWLADTLDSAPPSPSSPLSAVDASLLRLWGPGRIDAVTASGRLPVAIPDLRPIRWLTHLHHEGNLLQIDRQALAIRLETLIITSHGESLRPPRELALGLAHYLWTLAAALPDTAAQKQRGREAFAAGRCSACHAGPGMTGPPVDVAIVGTDPVVARDPDRGTGHYRVPSLRGVGSRGILLHDGSFRSLETMFDARRRAGTAAPAHPFGLGLPDSQRVDLIDFLRSL